MKFFLFLTFLLTFKVQAATYIVAQGGYMKLAQDAAMESNVTPAGFLYGGGLGIRKDYFEFEALILKGSAQDKIRHDGRDNTLVHEQTSLILAMNFYMLKSLYVRAGFGVHKVDQTLGDQVGAASQIGARASYGMIEDDLTEGVILGAGYVLYNGKHMDIFTQIERQDFSSVESGVWNATLGFKWYLE